MGKLTSGLYNRLVIAIPYAWLLLFFLAPFFIVFRISLSTTAIAMPPYEPVFSLADGWAGLWSKIGELSFDNYAYLTDDALYFNAYISSVVIAGISTFLTLLIAYPIAYGMLQPFEATHRPSECIGWDRVGSALYNAMQHDIKAGLGGGLNAG